MKHMHKTMLALVAVSLTAALLGYGCRDKAATQAAVVTPVAYTTTESVPLVMAATPDTSGPGAGGGAMYAELANPQSDDQGYYVPLPRDEHYSLIGYASGRRPVAQVMVNDVEADTFAANYQPYGSPSGYSPIGFRVPLTLGPASLVTVSMIDADGYRETMIFRPDRGRAYGRVHQLWQGSQDEPYANLRLANTFAVMGDYHNAYTRYHRTIGLSAGFMWGPFFMGVTLYDNSRYDDAMWQFRHCSRMDSGFYLARYQVGQCYERRGDYASAILEYRVVIGARPQFVQAHWSMGESYAQQSNWSGAAIQYREAIRYNPRFAPAHRGLGESLAHQGHWAGAAVSLNLAASINPRDARTRADLSSTMKHQQRSPQQYRVAMVPLSAPRGNEQGPTQNMRYTKSGQPYQAVTEQQARPSGAQQGIPSGRQQARPSVIPLAQPAVRQQRTQPSAAPQARPAVRQHQGQPTAKPTAKPVSGHQPQPSGGPKGKSSGDQADQKDRTRGR